VCIGIAYEGAQQGTAALYRHGDEVDALARVVMVQSATEHRGLFVPGEGFALFVFLAFHCQVVRSGCKNNDFH